MATEEKDLYEQYLSLKKTQPLIPLRQQGRREKGLGYFGKLKRPDGRVSTELSIGLTGPEFNWKETEVPSLVPTLTKE